MRASNDVIAVFIIILAMLIVSIPITSATSVDRIAVTNLEGYPEDVFQVDITLIGTLPDQTGHWRTSYKNISNDEKMDIRSWITINPTNYRLEKNESKTFTVTIKIPEDAEPGLYGAISEDAGLPGHSAERRTYIVFEDANTTAVIEGKGSVAYSGLLIPISVNVLGKPSPLTPIIKGIKANITVIILLAVIIILFVLLLRRKGGKEQGQGNG